MKLPDYLEEKINDFQAQMEAFSDLCKFVSLGADQMNLEEKTMIITVQSVLYIIKKEAERIYAASGEIFFDITQISE